MAEKTLPSEAIADETTIIRAVLDELKKSISNDVDGDAFIRTVSENAKKIYEDNPDLSGDEYGQKHLGSAASILALYKALKNHVADSEDRLSIIRSVLIGFMKASADKYIDLRFGLDADHPDRSFEKIKTTYPEGLIRDYGDHFEVEAEEVNEDRAFFNIKRCFFNDFFRRYGVPHVTKVCCALDVVWGDNLNDSIHNVTFDRPRKMSDGATSCSFNFTRSSKKA